LDIDIHLASPIQTSGIRALSNNTHIFTDALHLQYKRAEYVRYHILDMFYKSQEFLRFYVNKLYLCLFNNATNKSVGVKLITLQVRPNIM